MSARPPWLYANFTEPRVLIAVRDLCGAGETVFDVGANFGGITIGMSRAVGPRGVVCAFEANPSITARCQSAINENGCGNVQLFNNAIYSRSKEVIPLYLSSNEVGDSIHNRVSDNTIDVPTLALDDFVQQMKLMPQFIKMDIEGAEIDALEGFEKSIAASTPILVLEQIPSDNRCLAFLKKYGYQAIDLSTYSLLESVSELPAETVVTDILYATPDKLANTPYKPGITKVKEFESNDFDHGELISKTKPFHVEAGRYIVHAVTDSSREDKEEMFCGVLRQDQPLMRHHGHSDTLCAFAHRWVFDAPAGDISIYFQFATNYPKSFGVQHVTLYEVNSFRGRSQLLI